MQERYFAASNSAQGFKNYFGEIFKRADFIYIIKGGPGTGKSSFMRRCAKEAEQRGERVEYYYCSSDPDSLDGILVFSKERSVGIIDGTSPHVSEPKYPGAYDEIINLGQFWNRELLIKQKNEIIALSDRKSAEYKNAYTFLRSVGNLRAVNDSLVREAVDLEKMRVAAARLIAHIPDLAEGVATVIPTVTDSVSMNGRVRFDTFESRANKLYFVSDFYGVGHMFMEAVLNVLKGKGVTVRASFDPICPERVDGLFIEQNRIAFVLSNSFDEHPAPDADSDASCAHAPTVINVKRFVNHEKLRENRSEIRYTTHLAQSSLDGALHALAKAKIYHFLLEDIYGKAMHWREKDEFERSFVL